LGRFGRDRRKLNSEDPVGFTDIMDARISEGYLQEIHRHSILREYVGSKKEMPTFDLFLFKMIYLLNQKYAAGHL